MQFSRNRSFAVINFPGRYFYFVLFFFYFFRNVGGWSILARDTCLFVMATDMSPLRVAVFHNCSLLRSVHFSSPENSIKYNKRHQLQTVVKNLDPTATDTYRPIRNFGKINDWIVPSKVGIFLFPIYSKKNYIMIIFQTDIIYFILIGK